MAPASSADTTSLSSSSPFALPALERPTSRYRISDAVFAQLSEAIRNLSLPPGTPISEPAIANWLQVSRSPVREAFTRLVDLGLVAVVPQVGSRIAPISMREVEEAVFIRSALEVSAFLRAIESGPVDVTAMQKIMDANRAAFEAQDIEAFFDTDEALHQHVFTLAGFPHIWEIVRGAKMQLDRLRRLNLAVALDNRQLLAEHQSLVDAIRDRDEATGVATINTHATHIFDTIEQHRSTHPTYFAP